MNYLTKFYPLQKTLRERLDTLDGLRALAALGVLWIHSWTFHGNPRLQIAGLDITNLLTLGGNGVDLFFVISGFCMYYFYAQKTAFSYQYFWTFIKKRWLRLSPAFYTVTLIYILFSYNANHEYSILKSFFTSFFYLNSISSYNAAGLFWSLSAEWQFYLIIPFVLIYQHKYSFHDIFYLTIVILGTISILSVLILKKKSDFLIDQIIFRYFEFAWGIITARILLVKNYKLSFRPIWLIVFILLTYLGRGFLSKSILSLSESYYNLFKLIGFTTMGCGFGGILYLTVTSQKFLRLIIGNKLLSMIGRISFSFYLWHGLITIYIGSWVQQTFPYIRDIRTPIITFFVSTLILLPISLLSYQLLEKPTISQRTL